MSGFFHGQGVKALLLTFRIIRDSIHKERIPAGSGTKKEVPRSTENSSGLSQTRATTVVSRTAAAILPDLLQQRFHAFHALRMLGRHVVGFARIFRKVVKLRLRVITKL